MSNFNLRIKMDNAAFSEEEGGAALEVSEILDRVSKQIALNGGLSKGDAGLLMDHNGNAVGEWSVTKR